MMFTQETIEIWLRVQTNYLYLYPIFNSAGIQDEVKSLLDSEGFSTVDKAWHNIMSKLKSDTLALNLYKIENLETILKESNQQLENIQKNLNEYLEAKRNYFSRFFFLSNDDLIEILGDS
jgi:dynein heavy chain